MRILTAVFIYISFCVTVIADQLPNLLDCINKEIESDKPRAPLFVAVYRNDKGYRFANEADALNLNQVGDKLLVLSKKNSKRRLVIFFSCPDNMKDDEKEANFLKFEEEVGKQLAEYVIYRCPVE